MAKQTINIGTTANDGTGDTLRDGGDKINDNFTEIYGVSGILKSNGSTTLSAAVAGTDYYAPGSTDVAVTDGGTGASTASGARTNLGLVIGTDVQAYDADLATIAGLTATTDNFIQAKSSAWASRTPTQVTADLIAMVGDSGSGGTKGLVPAPAAGDAAANKFLKADGSWSAPSGGGGGASIITTPVNAAVGSSTDQYCQVGGTQTIALANEARNRWYCPRAGTVQKMYVWINAAANTQPASGSYEITIYKNNATAGPTITISAGATVTTVQSDTSTTLSVSAGDYLHIRLKNNATATACNVASITFEIAF